MANVLIAVLPHASHYLPTLRLASELASRGHRVTYVSTEESHKALVESHGFAFERLPVVDFGTLAPAWQDCIPFAGPLLKARRYLNLLVCSLAADEVPRLLARLQPKLVIIESTLVLFALALKARGAAVLSLSPYPQTSPGAHSPPLDCRLIPSSDNPSAVDEEWRRYFAQRDRTERRYAFLGLSQRVAARKLASLLHLNFEGQVDTRRFHFDVLKGPELSLCPKEFDFPGAGRPNWYACGPSIYTDRLQTAFDFTFLPAAKPLVYCAMGTVFAGQKSTFRGLVQLIWSFKERTDVELVASVGSSFGDPAWNALPPHIHVFAQVPQLQALARASVFLTHAGYGSVREAIFEGVPMLAMPLGADQQGIAARIEHHGLGIYMPLEMAHGQPLLQHFDALLNEPRFRASCTRMRDIFVRAESEISAASVAERLFDL